nr:retron St85 family effector protein [Hydrogenovibrio sp. JE_KL2]
MQKVAIERSEHHIFTCGGVVDIQSPPYKSFRDQFVGYTASDYPVIHDAIVQAEDFKDYFHQNTYTDLLVFEDEIANISSLVLIFLESPGSLVELGIFCSKPSVFEKLVIVAPREETKDADSFIYLGPLEFIRSKENDSVLIYPWPKGEATSFSKDNLIDLCEQLNEKITSQIKSKKFYQNNSGDMALLVYEIIRMSYPMLINDIEHVLTLGLGMNFQEIELGLKRHLYLLQKLRLIEKYEYGGNVYYYPQKPSVQMVKLGYKLGEQRIETTKLKLKMMKILIEDKSSQARKRKTVAKMIHDLQKSDEQ